MKFKKELIANYQEDILLYHIVAEGTNEEIGYRLGRLAEGFHCIEKSTNIHKSEIKSQYDYLKSIYPEHYARMAGFAKSYGKSLSDYNYDFSFFGQLKTAAACSVVYYPPGITNKKCGIISRNLDFSVPKNIKDKTRKFPFKHTYLLEMYPESCYPSISLFCFELFGLALEGINSEGLSVIHLMDTDTMIDHADLATMHTKIGFNEFLPIQYLLDKCSNANEAVKALKKMEHYHMLIPVHLLIADKYGNSYVFEYSSDGTKKVFVKGNATSPFKVTNCQLNRLSNPEMIKIMESRSFENGLNRYRYLEKLLNQIKFPVTDNIIQEINAAVYIYADRGNNIDHTLFHCIYDTSTCSVKICLLPKIKQLNGGFKKISLKNIDTI